MFRGIKLLLGLITLILGLLIYNLYPEEEFPIGIQVDKLVVFKSKRQMTAYSDGEVVKTYKISLGRNPIGAKEVEGDKKTPEGIYFINDKNPNSGYYKNLGVSFPNTEDIKQAIKHGKPTGGDIKIHGLRNKFGFIGKCHRFFDWTMGCIAITNQEIDELYPAVKIGTRIEIYP